MSIPRPKESEIVDVLLGESDPILQDQVNQAIGKDLTAAKQYAEWSRILPDVQQSALSAKIMVGRVKRQVLKQLPQERQSLVKSGSFPVPGTDLPSSILCGLLGPETGRRWYAVLPYAMSAASILLVLGFLSIQLYQHLFWSVKVEHVTGEALLVEDERSGSRALSRGDRFHLPARIRVMAAGQALLRFPHQTSLVVTAETNLFLQNSRIVRQASGATTYRVEQADKKGRFTVFVPQGAVVDMGTEFEVNVADADHSTVRVDQGSVSIMPLQGAEVSVKQGQRAILNQSQTLVEDSPIIPSDSGKEEINIAPEKMEDTIRREYQPLREPLSLMSDLAGFIRPVAVNLEPGVPEGRLKKAPPFTSETPLFGLVKVRVDDRPLEMPVVCDQKLNGKWRIHFDSNANNDLTDDPAFTEDEDFVVGKPFRVNLTGRNNMIWLSRPIQVDAKANPPRVAAVDNRLDCYNPVSLSSQISIQGPPERTGVGKYQFSVLDINSNGDYGDSDGALGVWLFSSKDMAKPQILSLAPVGSPSVAGGYKWDLSRSISGSFILSGHKLDLLVKKKLQVGEQLSPSLVQTVAGESLNLAPPRNGYLLIYVWSTWFSACQRDVPFDFNDLYPRFRDRGLRMIGLSMDYRKQDLLNYVAANQVPYPQVFNGPDLTEGVAAQLGIDRFPLAILVGPSGKVISIGKAADEIWSYLDERLPRK